MVQGQDLGQDLGEDYKYTMDEASLPSLTPIIFCEWPEIYYCDQIERWILNLNFPGFSKLKIFFP